MAVVNKETALKEVHEWLDYLKVSESSRESEEKQKQIEALADFISDGQLVINPDTKEITQTLLFPIGKEEVTETVKYKSRLNVGAVQRAMSGVKTNDLHGMIIAYGSAATGLSKTVIQAMDTQDYRVLQGIVVFFM